MKTGEKVDPNDPNLTLKGKAQFRKNHGLEMDDEDVESADEVIRTVPDPLPDAMVEEPSDEKHVFSIESDGSVPSALLEEQSKDAQIAALKKRITQIEAQVSADMQQKMMKIQQHRLVAMLHGVVEKEVKLQVEAHLKKHMQDHHTEIDTKFEDPVFDKKVMDAVATELNSPPEKENKLEKALEKGVSFADMEHTMAKADQDMPQLSPVQEAELQHTIAETQAAAARTQSAVEHLEQKPAEVAAKPSHALEAKLEKGLSFADIEKKLASVDEPARAEHDTPPVLDKSSSFKTAPADVETEPANAIRVQE